MELVDKKKQKLDKLYEKYKIYDNLIIGRVARKTIRYIEKNTENFPNKYLNYKFENTIIYNSLRIDKIVKYLNDNILDISNKLDEIEKVINY